MLKVKIIKWAVYICITAFFCGCDSIDDDRIPYAPVSIVFNTVGEWNVYGVASALDTRRFIKDERIPTNFPYTDMSRTGFGGVLLVCDYEGNPGAFDLSCPVEKKPTVRIRVIEDKAVGECPECHSTYDIFRYGAPLSGEAAEKGYGLRRYRVSSGTNVYMQVIN